MYPLAKLCAGEVAARSVPSCLLFFPNGWAGGPGRNLNTMYDGPIFVSTWRGTERTLGQLGAVERSIGKAPQAERALDYEQGKMVCWFLRSEQKGRRCGTHENIIWGDEKALTRWR